MVRIQRRRDTAEQWLTHNPVLQMGEEGFETDTKRKKTGDGVATWSALPYDNTIAFAPDGPGILLGNAGRSIRVNSEETGFEWYIPGTGGGEGGVSDHYLLTHIGTNTHAQIDTFIASKGQNNGLVPLGSDGKVSETYLQSYAPVNHIHETYAPLSHTHIISGVNGLTEALAGKAASDHNHTGTYSTSGHHHTLLDVDGLSDSLDGKTDIGHAHPMSDIASLQNTLSLLAPINSPAFTGSPSFPVNATAVTHTAGDNSTKLATTAYVKEATDSLVVDKIRVSANDTTPKYLGGKLVEGDNITLTLQDEGADEIIIISSTGGGGGSFGNIDGGKADSTFGGLTAIVCGGAA